MIRRISFTPEQMKRLREVCRALGTSYVQFVEFAVMQAVDEVEGYGRDQEAINDYYQRGN